MPENSNVDTLAEMSRDIASLRHEREILHEALHRETCRALAAEHLGKHWAVLWPQLLRRTRLDISKGEARLIAIDGAGKARTTWDRGKLTFVATPLETIVDEVKGRWPEFFDRAAPDSKQQGPVPENLTEKMRAERRRLDAEAHAPMSAAERAELRRNNPWRLGPGWNLTEQCRIYRRDPELARELEMIAHDS